MKYLLLGKQSGEGLTRHDERLKPARAKVRNSESNSVRSITPRAGTVLSTSRPRRCRKAMLNFSVWYVKQGFGSFESLPAFNDATMAAASKEE